MPRGNFAERMRSCCRRFRAAPARRRAARRDRRRPQVRSRSARCADRTDADRPFVARNFSSCAEMRRARCPSPRAGRGRGPRNTARSSAATALRAVAQPSRNSGCLSKRSSVTGASPPSAACGGEPGENPGGRVGSASPPESSAAMFQRSSAASTRRPARGPASPAPRSCPPAPPRAARPRWRALRPRHWRLRSSSTVASAASACASKPDRRLVAATDRSPPPAAALPRRAAREPRGAARSSTASRAMPMRASKACMANCGCPGAGAMPFAASPAISRHDGFVEIGVEAGQHDGAVRQPRDGGDQFRGRRNRAGRAGGDHRRRRSCAQAARPRP